MDHNDKEFTLGKVIDILNSTYTKGSSTSRSKALIQCQDLNPSDFKERINLGNDVCLSKANAMQTSIKVMRKSLKEQVKRAKTKPKSSSRRVRASHYEQNNLSRFFYPPSESSPHSRFSSALSQRWNNQSEALKEKDIKLDIDGLHSESRETIPLNPNRNIYSRHLQSDYPDSEAVFEARSGEKDKTVQEYDRRARKVSSASSVDSYRSDPSDSKQSFSNTTKIPRKRNESQSSEENTLNDEIDNTPSRNNPQDEKEFLETLTDHKLKTSLQKILQKRRNSVCLVKTSSGLRVVNEDGTYSVIAEETSDVDVESLMNSKSESKTASVFSRISKSCSASQKNDWSFKGDDPILSEWDGKSFQSEFSRISYPNISNKLSNSRRAIVPKRGVNSAAAKSITSAGSFPFWDKANVRTNKVETEETRIIKPLSSKSYRPCLTATSRAKIRSNTARSSPETSREKSNCMAENRKEVHVIRDFILMYAKVKQDKKEAEKKVDESKPVRMISATPEFVVKSAIGQFLTSSFPPERESHSSCGRSERHEDMQRTRLLKIKICMQQLASLT